MALGGVGFLSGLALAGLGWVGLVHSEPDLQGRFRRAVLDHLHSSFVAVTCSIWPLIASSAYA